MEISNRTIGFGLLVVVVLWLIMSIISTNNTVIRLEEDVMNSRSDVQVQEKRRFDLITRMVEVVEAGSQYEQETLTRIVELRSAVQAGNVESATTALKIVVEAYPELKANQNFVVLMNELSLTENLISEHRKSMNFFIREYRTYSRRFPNRLFIALTGYPIRDFTYLEFGNTDLPDELFSR